MTNVYASYLNKAGINHVAEELDRLGLDWDVEATCADITDTNSFMDMQPGDDCQYEISNIKAGRRGYGAYAFITISSEHVIWEKMED